MYYEVAAQRKHLFDVRICDLYHLLTIHRFGVAGMMRLGRATPTNI
jgi:hypothetical protein